MTRPVPLTIGFFWLLLVVTQSVTAQVAVQGETLYTMAGAPIHNGVVVITNGKISAVGPADQTPIPPGVQILKAKIVMPGLIDAHSTLGLSGFLNTQHDQEQLEHSAPIQPALRAVDAYNAQDGLISWVRSFGVTTVHTGHAPGELISGQTMIVKTVGDTVDEAVVVPTRAIACSLGAQAQKSGSQSPGTRGKMMSMLRADLIKAQEYQAKISAGTEKEAETTPRDLNLEALSQVLSGELVLMITADRATDIANALRLAREFNIRIWLDSAAESYLLVDEIKAAGVPVLIHATMARAAEERENLSFETAAKLFAAGIPVGMQSGYEQYVPKTRIVLFEAARAAAEGLSFEQAMSTITSGAAQILGVDHRVGSLQVEKDGDVALYNGDPFEYTSHCIGVVINGHVVSQVVR
ncbi:MAG: amidohydrolase family protein [Pirellulaceae bacterium]